MAVNPTGGHNAGKTSMKITSTAIAVAAAVMASMPGATAQTPQAPVDIIIQQGFSELVDVPGEIQDIAIGNPGIIDVQPLTSNILLMNGIALGTTNIIVIDDAGNALYRARVHVRPVRIWPGYSVKVVYGTSLGHGYSCDREAGCQSKEQPPAGEAPANIFLGETVVNTSPDAAGTNGAGGQSAPAAQ
jgi:hypothetical protein